VKTISVALATYNGERFLAEQLRSLAAQTVLPDELVVYDDGSTDGTLGIVADFVRASPFPVRVETDARRRGSSDAFFMAARSCGGDLVALCDQDDVFLPEKLERCRSAFERSDVLAVIHSSRVVDESLRPTGKLFPEVRRTHVASALTSDPWLAIRGMSMVVDARVVRLAAAEARPPSHYLEGATMHHDEWMYVLASSLGAVAFLAEPLALYRQHGGNATRIPDRMSIVRELVTTGWSYYGRRRDQARALERILDEFGNVVAGDAWEGGARRAARSFGLLADRLERRRSVYEPEVGFVVRSRRLLKLAHRGDYARGAGFGRRALARDALMIALGRNG
jgi:glycosyltransferase involved in cell wall biosynthesis